MTREPCSLKVVPEPTACGDAPESWTSSAAHPCVSWQSFKCREAEQQGALVRQRISYRHADILQLDPAEGTYDMITASYLIHEMPDPVTRQIFQKCRQLLKPGGVLALVDIDPE